MKIYDVIVIGAGSVGVPTTYFLAKYGLNVLCIDRLSSCGQGQNKAAIGGVRATHSDPAKIKICQTSLEIFSHWQEQTGVDIGWKKGGYCFPVYGQQQQDILQGLLPIQKEYQLNIDWVGADTIAELVPGITREGLIGGTYSPDDGQVSPLKAIEAIAQEAKRLGAEFQFDTEVLGFKTNANNKIISIETDKGFLQGKLFVNAAGAKAGKICELLGLKIPILPDSHEAGISAPIAPFLRPLVVDMRPGPEGKTANFYFGQNSAGQIIFCYTPEPIFPGENRESTSEFMPIIAKRLVSLIPRLKNLLIRRVWRGLYPMTVDGTAIVGKSTIENFYLGIGMCGQGFMMGPGVGANLASLIAEGNPLLEDEVFSLLSPTRDFYAKKELLK